MYVTGSLVNIEKYVVWPPPLNQDMKQIYLSSKWLTLKQTLKTKVNTFGKYLN